MSELLRIENLKTTFYDKGRRIQAVRGVDLSIKKGEVFGVVGESGSGKSVLMKSVMGIIAENAKIEDGSVLFNGSDLLKLSQKEKRALRGKDIAMIFQDPMTALDPLKTIGDHLVEVIVRHKKMSRADAMNAAIESLRLVNIPSPEKRVKQYPHEFSGGMRQRVMIAMGLSCQPQLLIADEPTTALDVTIQAQILRLLRELQEQNGMSVILITHDLGVVASLCHRIAVMYGGLVMEEGTADEIFYETAHPYTRALLASIPKHGEEAKQKLTPIRGTAPSLENPPTGCPFAARCDYVTPECEIAIPDVVSLSDTHRTRCVRARGGDK